MSRRNRLYGRKAWAALMLSVSMILGPVSPEYMAAEQTADASDIEDSTDTEVEDQEDILTGDLGAMFLQRQEAIKASFETLLQCSTPVRKSYGKYRYLYIGASRVAKMKTCVKDKQTLFVASPGAKVVWFVNDHGKSEPCLLSIKSYLAARPDGNVIIELGNNKLKEIDTYIYIYNRLIQTYPSAHFWFVDALPGKGPQKSGTAKNIRRQAFNAKLHEAFPDNCLGGYDYLWNSSNFKTLDGTHYSPKIAKRVYKYVMKMLGRKIKFKSVSSKRVIQCN